MSNLKVVCIGGFGHSVCVFDEMLSLSDVNLSAAGPAYEGENLDFIKNHKLFDSSVKVYEDYKKMLDEIKPDAAIISTRLDRIPAAAMDSAGRGIACICEKPLALDPDTLGKLHDVFAKKNVPLMAMFTARGESAFRTARRVYRSGAIGEAVLANARKSYKWGTRPEWFADRSKYGGTIGWVGIHGLDFINFITSQNFTSVAAMQGNFAHPERADCEDNCGLLLELGNGGHATVSVDLFRPESCETHGDDWVRIVGTKGIIEASGRKETCTVLEEGKSPYKAEPDEPKAIFAEFFNSLQGKGGNCDVSRQVSFQLTNTCLRAREAADSKTIKQIDNDIWE